MSSRVTSRSVSRHHHKNYLVKADEFHKTMKSSYEQKLWNPTAVNAIHCAISSADAITVFYLGFRHSGERYTEVIRLLQQIDIDEKVFRNKIQQLSMLLSTRKSLM